MRSEPTCSRSSCCPTWWSSTVSIDNPNVWYELGVRHALRSRGVIQINAKRDYLPFDVYTDRTLSYHLSDDRPSVPHPDRVEEDRRALAEFVASTMAAWHGRKVSPVYHLLQGLAEPDWRTLEVAGAREFWEAFRGWERRLEIARTRERPGDILVLAEEAPTNVLRLDARRRAGGALRSLGRFGLARAQYEKALEIDPADLESRRQIGILLGRLGDHPAAREWLEHVVEEHPNDPESLALLGRVEKDAWVAAGRERAASSDGWREAAADEHALLRECIEPYTRAFRLRPGHYYSGINAVTLGYLLRDLSGDDGDLDALQAMEGGVRWALVCALHDNGKDYWARVTLADLETLVAEPSVVRAAYQRAVAVADRDWFALDSSRQQLELLERVGFRRDAVAAGLEVLRAALSKLDKPRQAWTPNRVFLFSGHMIDHRDRSTPRFPPDQEPTAARAIAEQLRELDAGPGDLALVSAACGGDTLFAEACRVRGVRLEVRIPFEEARFLDESVSFPKRAEPPDGRSWVDRYYDIKRHAGDRFFLATDALGPAPPARNPFVRNNLWQLYSSLCWGPEKVHFIALSDGQAGDGEGGTRHMHDEVKRHAGHIHMLDTTALWTV